MDNFSGDEFQWVQAGLHDLCTSLGLDPVQASSDTAPDIAAALRHIADRVMQRDEVALETALAERRAYIDHIQTHSSGLTALAIDSID